MACVHCHEEEKNISIAFVACLVSDNAMTGMVTGYVQYVPRLMCMFALHYSDVTMSVMASKITDILIVCSTVCSGADQRKHQNSASLGFVKGIHWWPVENVTIWWRHHVDVFCYGLVKDVLPRISFRGISLSLGQAYDYPGTRGVTIHLVTIRFVLRYTACDTLHDTMFAIHISDILYIQKLSIGEDLGDRIYG